ncbi:hypothetical protein [Kangiella koreensis]|uniref:Lipoprotein n=1 Tax=Kangiella koreensis (strain DSM 16069 / JCM 12317 / KCTC 12182 / SW-125) TaxID=523791 RepID=C7R6L6_KANKD|nr:hypothetical protein [Kangiella koreensis]ACV25532.1 hypothetical protein Kkor_0111 [Kangiella koreensis DSM 16069]
MKILSLLMTIAILLSGCATGPYAIIDGSQSKITAKNSYDVIITGINGKMYFNGQKIKNIDVGPHYVQLTSTKAGSRGDISYQSWYFNAEPCKRYVVVANHDKDKQFSNNYWEVELLRVESIGGCKVSEDDKEESHE